MNDDDMPSDDSELRELPAIDIAPARAETIRRRAHAILRAEQQAPLVGSWAYLYERRVEPALLIGAGVCQVIWAVHGTLQLLMH
ncbi:MAG TPA: hypothetical protein VMG12_45220 [Polyangiaceae bacterium]|nr:hypothetical protein [Polyangiaceae bacterium]